MSSWGKASWISRPWHPPRVRRWFRHFFYGWFEDGA